MKKIIKCLEWFTLLVAGCSSAIDIRKAFANICTVKNAIEALNTAIIAFLITTIMAYIKPELLGESRMTTGPILLAITIWLWGLRIAVATSQQSRENYLRTTRRVCRLLIHVLFVVIVTALAVAWMMVMLATIVQIGGIMDPVVQIYPELELLSQIIVGKFSKVIHFVVVSLT